MRATLLLLAAVAASAQPGKDARPLLKSIAGAVGAAGSVRAEGVMVEEATGQTNYRQETRFDLVTQGPLLIRYHAVNGANRVLQICDGTSRWNYFEATKTYTRTTEEEALCAPPVARFRERADDLVSAEVTGRDRSEFEGRSRECQIIEAVYLPVLPRTGRLTRTLCVDPVRRLILRERLESTDTDPHPPTRYSTTITYSRVTYNRTQPVGVFQFEPPAGSSQGGFNLPLTGEGGSGNYAGPRGGTAPAPVLLYRREPQYTTEALQAKLQGTVVVSLVIDEKGRPRNIQVVRGLGMGLDEKAIDAVGGWRFKQGFLAGLPISVPAQVEVNFRLP